MGVVGKVGCSSLDRGLILFRCCRGFDIAGQAPVK